MKQRLGEGEALKKELADEMKKVKRNETILTDKVQKESRAKEKAEAEVTLADLCLLSALYINVQPLNFKIR